MRGNAPQIFFLEPPLGYCCFVWLVLNAKWQDNFCLHLLLLLHSFNGLFFQDNPGKPAPEKQNHSGKTSLELLEQEIMSGSRISWAICKSAPRFREITMPAPHHSVFYRRGALPTTQPTASKHWRQILLACLLAFNCCEITVRLLTVNFV